MNGAGTPGLGGIRSTLNRNPGNGTPPEPHDPFEVDTKRAVDALKIRWDDAYRIIACEGGYEAARRHGPLITLTAPTPDGLNRAMLRDWASW